MGGKAQPIAVNMIRQAKSDRLGADLQTTEK